MEKEFIKKFINDLNLDFEIKEGPLTNEYIEREFLIKIKQQIKSGMIFYKFINMNKKDYNVLDLMLRLLNCNLIDNVWAKRFIEKSQLKNITLYTYQMVINYMASRRWAEYVIYKKGNIDNPSKAIKLLFINCHSNIE